MSLKVDIVPLHGGSHAERLPLGVCGTFPDASFNSIGFHPTRVMPYYSRAFLGRPTRQ